MALSTLRFLADRRMLYWHQNTQWLGLARDRHVLPLRIGRNDFVIDPALRVAPADLYFPSLSGNDRRPLVLRRFDPRGECVGPSAFDADYVQQFVARVGIMREGIVTLLGLWAGICGRKCPS